eukprot:3446589-Rhodomonas_salina.2
MQWWSTSGAGCSPTSSDPCHARAVPRRVACKREPGIGCPPGTVFTTQKRGARRKHKDFSPEEILMPQKTQYGIEIRVHRQQA